MNNKKFFKKQFARYKGLHILIKISISQQDITYKNAPNNRQSKYMKQKLTQLKGEINSSKLIFGHFKTPLSKMDRIAKQKISKEIKSIVNQLDLADIHRALYWTTTAHAFFSGAHGTFYRIDNMLSHIVSLNRF